MYIYIYFLATTNAYGSYPARDQIRATAITYATAAAVPNP